MYSNDNSDLFCKLVNKCKSTFLLLNIPTTSVPSFHLMLWLISVPYFRLIVLIKFILIIKSVGDSHIDLFSLHDLFDFSWNQIPTVPLLIMIFGQWAWILAAQDQKNKQFIFATGICRLVVIKWMGSFSTKLVLQQFGISWKTIFCLLKYLLKNQPWNYSTVKF